MKALKPTLFVALLLAVVPVGAQAAGDLDSFLKELKLQLDRGEKERLADPWYLKDLRDLVHRYDWPWQKRLFSDDFSGQGPGPGEPWQVLAGEMLIDWRHGLRSVIEPPAPEPAQQQAQQDDSANDPMKQLLGQILQEALKDPNAQQQAAQQDAGAAAPPDHASAAAQVGITNAFAVALEMTARPLASVANPRFEVGPYQGQNTAVGYRLVYNGGNQAGVPSLELLRLSSRGTSVLEAYDQPLALEDGAPHKIMWTRGSGGQMTVTLDGTQVISVVDRGFRDPFNGLVVANGGGDFALRQVTIDGVE